MIKKFLPKSSFAVSNLTTNRILKNMFSAEHQTGSMIRTNSFSISHSKQENEVIINETKNVGHIILNRPKALNALNLSMVKQIYPALKKWQNSKNIVIIEGSGGKAFCAGGDVKSLVLDAREGGTLGHDFFREEYTLNHLIGTYKIPYMALMNGITMGGGVGLSVHGKYRVATETTLFAMPETAIGLFPDVGGTYFLPRLPDYLGYYLGLTGHRLRGMDVKIAGIATHFVPSEKLLELKELLMNAKSDNIEEILNRFNTQTETHEFSLAPYLHKIKTCFSAANIEEILIRLQQDNTEWAQNVIDTLLKMSPTSLKVTKEALDRGLNLNLLECLSMEYRLSRAALTGHSDFIEGVRALLIDKDQKPKWNPSTLSEIDLNFVNKRFEIIAQKDELFSKL